jgi:hypothetical protein
MTRISPLLYYKKHFVKRQNDYLHLEDFTETKFDEIVSGDCRARWFIRTVTVGTDLKMLRLLEKRDVAVSSREV